MRDPTPAHRPMTAWPAATIAQALALLVAGHSRSRVSATVGVPRTTIGTWLHRAGVVPPLTRSRLVAAARRADAGPMVAAGWTWGRIARTLAVPVRTVYKWRLREGWARRGGRVHAGAARGSLRAPPVPVAAWRPAMWRCDCGQRSHQDACGGCGARWDVHDRP
jgi:hypothetical protein